MTENEYVRACNIAYITAAKEALQHVLPDWLRGDGGKLVREMREALYRIHQDELEHLELAER